MIEKNKCWQKHFSSVRAARGKNSPLGLGINSKIWNQIGNPKKHGILLVTVQCLPHSHQTIYIAAVFVTFAAVPK